MSVDAAEDIPDNLDFVYIDGNHKYEFVKQDIEAYYPKIKIGGVIGGHDIDNGTCPNHSGLTKAVLEFVIKHNLELQIGGNDWWAFKK
jgi:hypothetical protein